MKMSFVRGSFLMAGFCAIGLVHQASAAPLTPASLIGGLNSGTYVFSPAVAGAPGTGIFGAEFSGPTAVNSMTFAQLTDAGRRAPQTLRIYTDHTTYRDITLANTQAAQTIDFTQAANGGAALQTSPFLVAVVTSMYSSPGADANWGLNQASLAFDGTTTGSDLPNLNAAATFTNPTGNVVAGGVSVLNDGDILSDSTGKGIYWSRTNGVQDQVVATYSTAQSIGSVGLGLNGDQINRDAPRFVTLTDSNNISQTVTLDPDQTQYERYTLTSPFLNTTSLTLTFPDEGTAANPDSTGWYVNGDVNYGLTEFQAFAPVPEPASLGLLAVAGLALLRRRHVGGV